MRTVRRQSGWKLATRQNLDERREAIDAVRRVMMATNLPLASPENPLGLEPGADGTIPALTVDTLEGDAREPRLRSGTTFVEFLNGNDGFI